jgi:hypothetical protein
MQTAWCPFFDMQRLLEAGLCCCCCFSSRAIVVVGHIVISVDHAGKLRSTFCTANLLIAALVAFVFGRRERENTVHVQVLCLYGTNPDVP